MMRITSTRRQADDFAAALDSGLAGAGSTSVAHSTRHAPQVGRSPARTAETLAFVSLVEELRRVESPPMSDEFASDLRARLMSAAPIELSAVARTGSNVATQPHLLGAASKSTSRSPLRRRLISLGLTGGVVLVASSGVAVASQSALPGETLYPVKRSLERMRVSVAGSAADKGGEWLDQAGTRLDEVDGLATGGLSDPSAPSLVFDTLGLFATQSAEGAEALMSAYSEEGDSESIATLRAFTEQSVDDLSDLGEILPSSMYDELTQAAEEMTDLDARARQMCSTCSPLAPLQLSGSLILGPGQLPGAIDVGPGAPAPPAPGQPPDQPGPGQGSDPGSGPGGLDPEGGDPSQLSPQPSTQPDPQLQPSDPLPGDGVPGSVLPTTVNPPEPVPSPSADPGDSDPSVEESAVPTSPLPTQSAPPVEPTVTAPSATLPTLTAPTPTLPTVSAPTPTLPTVTAPTPTLPTVTAPTSTLPTVTAPVETLPTVSPPTPTLPLGTELSTPLPSATVPSPSLPLGTNEPPSSDLPLP